MHTPMSDRGTVLAAAIVTAVTTVYMAHKIYLAITTLDAVPVPARYLDAPGSAPGDG